MKTWVKAAVTAAVVAAAVGGINALGAFVEHPDAVMLKSIQVTDQAITLDGDLASSGRAYRRYRLLPDQGGKVYVKVITGLVLPWPSNRSGAFHMEIPVDRPVSKIYLQGPGTSRLVWEKP